MQNINFTLKNENKHIKNYTKCRCTYYALVVLGLNQILQKLVFELSSKVVKFNVDIFTVYKVVVHFLIPY